MKSYGQLCAVARALDVVGDRWTLLVVRELLIQGPLRFGELQRGLPGIATNLLSQRLRDLEEQGVLSRTDGDRAPGPPLYRLTARGRALDGVMRELLKWGAPTVPTAPPEAVFQMHWLSQPARYLLNDHEPDRSRSTIRFGTPADGFDVTAASGTVTVTPCTGDARIDATVTGPGPALVALIQGAMGIDSAEEHGVTVEGDATALTRVLPRPA
ncbi:winged helix-turn-helix transcriptional regulator [Streptomyces rubiginosohelvolus]|uniref:winged helix-turn-helix transcriptional regulator n=1 Tax=Streptomyces rubiginosohelvolus TaxID=67362 RepID=UPI0036B5C8F5